jgi:zinc transport system substrate-binding protein
MFRITLLFLILVPALFLASCQGKSAVSGKPQLTVSIIPQKYLVNYIAGDKFDIQVMLPAGSNHEAYEPTPRDMTKMSSSQLYFELGALDFEIVWMERFKEQNPRMRIVNTSAGITMLDGNIHTEKDSAEHASHGIDPHTWLSPACMKIQAANICSALSTADSVNASFYKDNLDKFNRLADSVDTIIREKLASSSGKTVLIFHPALAYFARDYNLNQVSIEQDGKEPSPANMGKLIKIAKQNGIRAVFISKEFDTRNAEAIAKEINGEVVVFNPMAENWADNLIQLADLIAKN